MDEAKFRTHLSTNLGVPDAVRNIIIPGHYCSVFKKTRAIFGHPGEKFL